LAIYNTINNKKSPARPAPPTSPSDEPLDTDHNILSTLETDTLKDEK
jgi:hypothetical protein